jgi:hypothetical protein
MKKDSPPLLVNTEDCFFPKNQVPLEDTNFGGSMAISLSNDQVRLLRLHAQRLARLPQEAVTSATQVVKDLCGIQAQKAPAAALAIRVRSAGLVAGDIEQARVQSRTITRQYW